MTTILSTRQRPKSRPTPTKTLLFQRYPAYGHQRHGFAVTTILGRIAWSARLAGQLLANEKLIGPTYRYPYCGTVKFLDELDVKDIRRAWAAICRKLRDIGMVAHWNMEVARTNLVDFHLVIRDCPAHLLTSRERKLKAAIRSVCSHRLNLQFDPIKTTSRKWINYVLKTKIRGVKNSKTTIGDSDFDAMIAANPDRFTDDLYSNKRVIIAPKCGLKSCGKIGNFWQQSKERFTAQYKTQKAEAERLAMEVWREADKLADLLATSTEAVQKKLVAQKRAEPGYTPPTPPPPKPRLPRKPKQTKTPLPPFDPARCDSFTIGETFETAAAPDAKGVVNATTRPVLCPLCGRGMADAVCPGSWHAQFGRCTTDQRC